MIEFAVRRLGEEMTPELHDLLDGAVLVPMPKSAPLPPTKQAVLWVPKRICEALRAAGHGLQVAPCLDRVKPVPKSAFAAARERPTPRMHLESMRVNKLVGEPSKITIVDDVITKGATAIAAVSLLKHAYPEAKVRVFAMVRTRGLVHDIDKIIDQVYGEVTLNKWGGAERSHD